MVGSSKLVTVARDGIVKIWNVICNDEEKTVQLVLGLSFSPFEGMSVTAVDILFQPFYINKLEQSYWLISLGAENGNIQIWGVSEDFSVAQVLLVVPTIYCHGATVHKLKWRANAACDATSFPAAAVHVNSGGSKLYFASCGEDHSVRVHVVEP